MLANMQQQMAAQAQQHRDELAQIMVQLNEGRRATEAALQEAHVARQGEQQAHAERRETLELALRAAGPRGGDRGEIVDLKGVGQPHKYTGKEEAEFAEWAHKFMVFVSAKFGPDFEPLLRWSGQQRKQIRADDGIGEVGCARSGRARSRILIQSR